MTRWPLQDMLGADLLAAAARRIEADYGPAGDVGGDPTGPCGSASTASR